MSSKQEILGQYFTKAEIVRSLLDLLQKYKKYSKDIKILEPSFGTGNFINELKKKNFSNIVGCEIDKDLTDSPSDFFEMPIEKKFDLIVGNPPFSKYNLKESYFYPGKYERLKVKIGDYLTNHELKKEKERMENIFILKSLKQIKSEKSSIAFVLPISFFIKNKNKSVKREILKYFSTVIVYQNDKVWFDRNIPCCFAIFSNSSEFKNKIILHYENGSKHEEVFDIKNIYEELIPQVAFHKNNGYIKNDKGTPLNEFLENRNVKVNKSFKENNISAKNILEKTKIPNNKTVEDYKIAVVRVGNASVGKCGLINEREDVLNDMFYVFDVKECYKKDGKMKQAICMQINGNIDYFRNITCRVGSKSIKKEDVFNFKINI